MQDKELEVRNAVGRRRKEEEEKEAKRFQDKDGGLIDLTLTLKIKDVTVNRMSFITGLRDSNFVIWVCS